MHFSRVLLGILFVLGVGLLLAYLSLHDLLPTFEEVRAQRMEIEAFLMAEPVLGAVLFVLGYALIVALSVPVATVLTLLGGFLFGSVLGTALVAVGATLGATIVFLLARFFFRDFFEKRVGAKLALVDLELEGHGLRDVLLLRLAPVVPFWLINIGAGLTGVRLRDYVLATFFGILPFTFVYANAGTRLAELERPGDVVSLPVLLAVSLVVLASFLAAHFRRTRRGRNTGERVDTSAGS